MNDIEVLPDTIPDNEILLLSSIILASDVPYAFPFESVKNTQYVALISFTRLSLNNILPDATYGNDRIIFVSSVNSIRLVSASLKSSI